MLLSIVAGEGVPQAHIHPHGVAIAEQQFNPSVFCQLADVPGLFQISEQGLNSTGGLSNNSNGMPKHIRPIMDSAMVAMAMMQR